FIQGGEEPEPTNLQIFGTTEDDIFDAADSSDDFNGNGNIVFADGGNDLVDASQAVVGQNRIYGQTGNDELFAGVGDRLFGGEGDDILDASAGRGDNHLYGQEGNDELFAGVGDRLFGGEGDDILDASVGRGGNRLLGEDGKDIFFAGSGDRLVGGDGDDVLFVTDGGNNIFSGGEGSDAFWIATGELVTEANTITDFDLEADVIGVGGLGIASTEDLAFKQIGDDAAIAFSNFDLAVLQNTQASDLQANATFVFA
nr:calcium-binding protein [Xenococcaceae cyanobacterium MO_234.B1]